MMSNAMEQKSFTTQTAVKNGEIVKDYDYQKE